MTIWDTLVGGGLAIAGGIGATVYEARRAERSSRRAVYEAWASRAAMAATAADAAADANRPADLVSDAQRALDDLVEADMAVMLSGAGDAIESQCRAAARSVIAVREGSATSVEMREQIRRAVRLMADDASGSRQRGRPWKSMRRGA